MAKEIWKSVEIDGESYSIRKFDAMTGLQIARLLLAKAAPLLPLLTQRGETALDINNATVFELVGKIAESASDEDIKTLFQKCLRVCYANLPAGKQAVMDEHGNYGVEDVEYDFNLALKLCFEAIQWGASDFFGGNGLGLIPTAK